MKHLAWIIWYKLFKIQIAAIIQILHLEKFISHSSNNRFSTHSSQTQIMVKLKHVFSQNVILTWLNCTGIKWHVLNATVGLLE